MGGSISNAFSQSKQQSSGIDESQTLFPATYLRNFSNVIGAPFSVQELIAALPQSQGLFGGGQVGAIPGATAGASVPGGAPAAPAGPRAWNQGELTSFARNVREQEGIGALLRYLPDKGAGTFTSADLRAAQAKMGSLERERTQFAISSLEAQEQLQAQQQNRLSSQVNAPGVGAAVPGGVQGGINALRFGQTPTQYAAPTIGAAPQINPRGANIAEGDFNRFEGKLFESQFRPAEREASRRQDLEERQLQAQLAQRGIAGSGTGLGQQRQQQEQFRQELGALASDAANRASVQRFQLQYDQELANAGFDANAQAQNADNVLKGNVANADAYLRTLGINQEEAKSHRNDFLQLLGLQEEDLKRLDQQQLATTDRLLNWWLQSASVLGDIGRIGQGQQGSRGIATGGSSSGSGGSSGGGGGG